MGPQIVNPGPNAPSLELQQIIRLIVEQQRQANENQIRLQEQMAKKDVDEDAWIWDGYSNHFHWWILDRNNVDNVICNQF